MTKKIALLPLFWILYLLCTAQGTIQLSGYLPKVQTAEAAAVQRYASYPMDYSTGLPNITIPLYEIKVGDISLPITLSYHSSGFRPNEAAGRIATGWTLNAEPSISKQVRGLDDGAPLYGLANYNPDLYKAQYGANIYNKRIADGKIDAMSDVYFYRLADKSGSFVMASAGSVKEFVPQPYSDTKITGSTNNITIEDDNGISYKFGGGDGYIERYYHTTLPVSLLCSEISSKMTKAKVSFVYNSTGLINFDYHSIVHADAVIVQENVSSLSSSPLLTKIINGVKKAYYILGPGNLQEIPYGTDYNPYVGGISTTQIIETQPLSKIIFDNGSMVFEGDNRSSIDIYVKDKSNNTVKEINLYTSPYRPYGNTDMQHRKLDSIRISFPGGDIRRYTFEYLNLSQIPDRDTRFIDYWGFCNNTAGSNMYNSNISMVPGFSVSVRGSSGNQFIYEHTGMDRTPNVAATKTGMLSKITDPDGIETIFEYEGNRTGIQYQGFYPNYGEVYDYLPPDIWLFELDSYSPQINFDIPVGGLRIKRITER
ncbi:MAG: hypothetical protein LBS79_11440, partial [Tannerella sp.]|nr:hypothetical protein [Tannerella sp.]